ncbi:MAG: EAL domain-containing protein (putative c-di-GMP-specific phosphodiesterase class I) [Pseudohongiellaceae bacterium]|jgi:EAL domain-containing protein (putative c-di-GMP-specific phosphodiesterase class I)
MNTIQILKNILVNEEITNWFQPVIDLSSMRATGWKVLSRGPSTTPFHAASALLNGAEYAGILKPLELMCVKNAAINFEQLLLGGKLFVNISHEMLFAGNTLRDQLKKLISKSPVSPFKVVIELNIRNKILDNAELKESIKFFHELGFQLAIDNLGSGAWSEEWHNLDADYVKIDRHIIHHIDADTHKQDFVRNTVAIAKASGIKIIAEGVETLDELSTVRKLGVDLVQGFLFQRPELSPVYPDMGKLNAQITSTQPDKKNMACNLVIGKESVSLNTPITEIIKLFTLNEMLESVVLLEKTEIHGLLQRQDLKNITKPYTRPVSELIDRKCLMVDSFLPLDEVSQLVTARPKSQAGNDFIVTNQNKFLGTTSVIELLRQITHDQRESL